MKLLHALFAFCLAACAAPSAAQQRPTSQLPEWWRAHVEFMSRDGGVWVSPNPPGQNDTNQPDAYAMEWRAAYDGHVLIGRLYGLEDDREVAEFWAFR